MQDLHNASHRVISGTSQSIAASQDIGAPLLNQGTLATEDVRQQWSHETQGLMSQRMCRSQKQCTLWRPLRPQGLGSSLSPQWLHRSERSGISQSLFRKRGSQFIGATLSQRFCKPYRVHRPQMLHRSQKLLMSQM